jgi:hypothetical protein
MVYWKILQQIYTYTNTHPNTNFNLSAEILVSEMQTNIWPSFRRLIQGLRGVRRSKFLALYLLQKANPRSQGSAFRTAETLQYS